MTIRPILFSDEMVRALLAGRKTMTRRVLKPQPFPVGAPFYRPHPIVSPREFHSISTNGHIANIQRVPYAPGDLLWVRENWRFINCMNEPWIGPEICIGYEADGPDLPNRPILKVDMRWYEKSDGWWYRRKRPSIHMPRWASRLTLEVTGVKVERLQEISDEEAIAEGCPGVLGPNPDFPDEWDPAPAEQFRDLWNSLNGPTAWDANPWVAAISFKVHRGNVKEVARELEAA